jgi:hypothetical protein
MVDLDWVGPSFEANSARNLPLETAIEVLEYELESLKSRIVGSETRKLLMSQKTREGIVRAGAMPRTSLPNSPSARMNHRRDFQAISGVPMYGGTTQRFDSDVETKEPKDRFNTDQKQRKTLGTKEQYELMRMEKEKNEKKKEAEKKEAERKEARGGAQNCVTSVKKSNLAGL